MLRELQARLERQYRSLHEQRRGKGYPVFGLEHGLDQKDVDHLRDALSSEFRRSGRVDPQVWLCWVAAATEVGYSFDGDEFWRSFAAEFPDWMQQDRYTLKGFFRQFAQRYGGLIPTGPWAEHFSIIAWPITHSILPRDLQTDFARTLYICRFELARDLDISPEEIGRRLKQRVPDDVTRFGLFLQQTSLTGHLVLALRAENVAGTVSPLCPTTLARIVSDLERIRAARDWLSEARRVMREASVSASKGLAATVPAAQRLRIVEKSERASHSTATLAARRAADGRWLLGVTFPPFKAILSELGIKAGAFNGTRFRLVGQEGTWRPGQALTSLSGSETIIPALPTTPAVVIFERSIRAAEAIMGALSLKGRSPWLLRMHADGVARQVAGHHVRADETYVLASAQEFPTDVSNALGLSIERREPGTCLYLLKTPSRLTSQHLDALTELNLGYAVGARVAPVGLLPRWNAVGTATEWLPNEEVMLQLSADFPVREYTVTIDGTQRTRIPAQGRAAIICSLGALAIGSHTVEVTAQPDHQFSIVATKGAMEKVTVAIEVREPRDWTEGLGERSGFKAVVEPLGAGLDQLLAGRASTNLIGPSGRRVQVDAEFFDANGHPDQRIHLGHRDLPVSPRDLAPLYSSMGGEANWDRLQGSSRVDLIFSAEELGSARVTFLNQVEPLRWRVEGRHDGCYARLIDEADGEQEIVVEQYNLTSPGTKTPLYVDKCLEGMPLGLPGSLFVARVGSKRYRALLVPPPGPRMSLADLRLAQRVDEALLHPRSLPRLLNLGKLWRGARTNGYLAAIRKDQTLKTLANWTRAAACGKEWLVVDLDGTAGVGNLRRLERLVGDAVFAKHLANLFEEGENDLNAGFHAFNTAALNGRICSDAKLCRDAFLLAFDPAKIRLDDPRIGREYFEALAGNKALVGGAFFAKALTDARCARLSGVAA